MPCPLCQCVRNSMLPPAWFRVLCHTLPCFPTYPNHPSVYSILGNNVIKELKGLVVCFIYHMVSYFNKNGHWFSFSAHLAHNRAYTYSGTPLFRMSETRTSRINGWFAQVWMAFPLRAIHYNPWKADTPLLAKADRFFGSFSTLDCANNADACLPLTQGCLPPLINPTTDHYIALVYTILASGQPF